MAPCRPRAPAFALGLALLLPPLAGCDPCESSEDLEILDESGVLNKAEIEALRSAYRDFMAWTPSEGICLSRLEIASDPDEPQGLRQGTFGSASQRATRRAVTRPSPAPARRDLGSGLLRRRSRPAESLA